MRIAIASTGLGHVQRGIEAWALSLAEGLAREGESVTLFCAEKCQRDEGGDLKPEGRKGERASEGMSTNHPMNKSQVVLPIGAEVDMALGVDVTI